MSLPTAAEREAMYRRIFQAIPRSFLDPDKVENQLVIGAIAYAIAYTEKMIDQFEQGLFLDTATDDDATEAGGGISSLDRWRLWLRMERIPNETPDQLRARIQARLFTPKLTIEAIENAVTAATGLLVRVEEPGEEVVRLNDGPWRGKKLLGRRYSPFSINVVTEGHLVDPLGGTTSALPHLMPFLRAAGIHWRHLELVRAEIALLLEGKQASVRCLAREVVSYWPQGFRPNFPIDPHAHPLRGKPYLFDKATLTARTQRQNHGAGAYLVAGPPGAPYENVLERYIPPDLPTFNWDDSTTLWDESVWAD